MKKVTEEELRSVRELREKFVTLVTTVGELTISKFVAEEQVTKLTEQLKLQQDLFAQFQEQERVLFEKLQQTYGTGNIDMETGEISE